MSKIVTFQKSWLYSESFSLRMQPIKTGALFSLLLLPGYIAASDNYYRNFTGNIERVSVYTSFYTQHFSPEPDHVNDQNMLGLEMRLVNRWIYGATLFDNSFGQTSQYLYTGYQWNISDFSSYGAVRQHLKLTGGLLHGYKDEYQDKIPFNGLGVAPAIVPTYGVKYKNLVTEASFGGVSAFTITVGYSF